MRCWLFAGLPVQVRDAFLASQQAEGMQQATSFVGRDAEAGQLVSVLRSNLAGKVGVTVVSGPAGIGKSALVAETRRRTESLSLRWLAATCVEN